MLCVSIFFFFSSRRRHTRCSRDWSSDVCSSGMRGVYLVAAELVGHGFVVSVTSRSAAGADLLVTDDTCAQAWSVQVKATPKPTTYWLLGPRARQLKAPSHVYVFVARMGGQPEFYVVPSRA